MRLSVFKPLPTPELDEPDNSVRFKQLNAWPKTSEQVYARSQHVHHDQSLVWDNLVTLKVVYFENYLYLVE